MDICDAHFDRGSHEHYIRFGRRIPLPSTVQILHDLKVLFVQEEGRKRYVLADGLPETASWDEIGAHRARAEREVASAAAARLLE